MDLAAGSFEREIIKGSLNYQCYDYLDMPYYKNNLINRQWKGTDKNILQKHGEKDIMKRNKNETFILCNNWNFQKRK